ncbi:MAG: hypothetical protein V3W41_20710 [Planctomycetota bacterium]
MHRIGFLMFLAVLAGGLAWPQSSFAQDDKTLEERLDAIDVTDPDQLQEIAAWAMKNKNRKVRKEGRKLMKEVLELDEDHEAARASLGHVHVGKKWFKSKKAAEKAKFAMVAKEMKAKGYVKFKNGFIKKTDRRKWKKNWEKNDDLIWVSYEDVMRAKGYAKYEGEWLRVSKTDAKRAANHTRLTGEDILIVSSDHFIFHFQIPVKLVKRYTELVERLLDWFYEKFEFAALLEKDKLFNGNKPHIWGFSSQQQLLDWVTAYAEDYKFSKEMKEEFRKRPGGTLFWELSTVVNEKPEDMENGIIHQIAVMIFRHFIGKSVAPWMSEAVANLAEHELSREKIGVVTMSTGTKYDNNGGVADKKNFNTKDTPPQVKGLVKRADDLPIEQLSNLKLNSLNEDHLGQGYSHIEWAFNHDRAKLVEWLHYYRTSRFQNVPKKPEERNAYYIMQCLEKIYGWDGEEYMKNWRSYVKKNYR